MDYNQDQALQDLDTALSQEPSYESAIPEEPKQFPIPDINTSTGIDPLPDEGDTQPEELAETAELEATPEQEPQVDETIVPETTNVPENYEKSIDADTELYYIRNKSNYEFETVKQSINGEDKSGCWFYTTTKGTEKIVLEEWEDKFVYKYVVSENIGIHDEQRKFVDKCLYKELELNPDEDEQVFILEQDLDKLKVQDHYLVKHDYIASSLGIETRRFAVIEQGEIVCAADKDVVKNPKPDNDEAGCFFYVTTILPEESVLQDWEDKTLNVYYFNEPMVLPYGADNEPDPFFDDIYIDRVEGENGNEERIFSYYDDNVTGEYLQNEPKTAEIFLIEADLKKLSYYGSYDLKLETIKFIHHIEQPMYE